MTEITDHLNPESHGIEVREVNKEFGDFQAPQDDQPDRPRRIDDRAPGPSGSGASTCFAPSPGEVPTSGQVFIGGEDQAKPVRTRNVGFVFQHYAAFKHMTVFDNIAFGLKGPPGTNRRPATGSTS